MPHHRTLVTLVPATREDIPALVEFDRTLFPREDLFDEETYGFFESYFICTEGESVGYLGFARDAGLWTFDDDEPPYVEGSVFAVTLGIVPKRQGEGLGRAALRCMVDLCREGGYRSVISCCRVTNVASNALHESAGFRFSYVHEGFYANPDGSAENANVFEVDL